MKEIKKENKILLSLILSIVLCLLFSICIFGIDIEPSDNLGGVELLPLPINTAYFYSHSDSELPPQFVFLSHSGNYSIIYSKSFDFSPRTYLLERGSNEYINNFLEEEFEYFYNNGTTLFYSSTSSVSITFKGIVDYYHAYDVFLECYKNQYVSACTSIVQDLNFSYEKLQYENEINEKTTQIILKNERIESLESYNEILTMENNSLNNQIENLRNEYQSNYELAYQNGYTKGFDEANWFERGLNSIFSSPSYMLHSFLNFEIFGINVLSIFLMVITLLIVGFIIKRFI